MSFQDTRNKLENDPDFILIKRFDFSLKKLIEKNPNGVSSKIAAQALGMPEKELEAIFAQILAKLKKQLANDDNKE